VWDGTPWTANATPLTRVLPLSLNGTCYACDAGLRHGAQARAGAGRTGITYRTLLAVVRWTGEDDADISPAGRAAGGVITHAAVRGRPSSAIAPPANAPHGAQR